jgi:hypothetical protein
MRLRLNILRCKKLNERGIYNLQGLTSYGLHNFKMSYWTSSIFYFTTILYRSKSQGIVHNKISLLDGIAKHERLFNYYGNYSGN